MHRNFNIPTRDIVVLKKKNDFFWKLGDSG